MATRPSLPIPRSRAISSTRVKASLSARGPPPKRRQRPVVHPRASRQIAERQVFAQPLLDPPRAGDPRGVPVQPQAQHQPRVILRSPSSLYSRSKALTSSRATTARLKKRGGKKHK